MNFCIIWHLFCLCPRYPIERWFPSASTPGP